LHVEGWQTFLALENLGSASVNVLTWKELSPALGLRATGHELWHAWNAHLGATPTPPVVRPVEPPTPEVVDPRRSVEETFKTAPLLFFHSIARNVTQEGGSVLPLWTCLKMLRIENGKRMHVMVQTITGANAVWFRDVLTPFMWNQESVQIYNLLQSPIQQTPDSRLYSALIRNMGSLTKKIDREGRVTAEWLAYWILRTTSELILADTNTCVFANSSAILDSDITRIILRVCWAPHKMMFDGKQMVSVAYGSHERSDFYLTAIARDSGRVLQLCCLYHTTNFSEHTYTNKTAIPETRFLVKGEGCYLGYVDDAIKQLVSQMHNWDLKILESIEAPATQLQLDVNTEPVPPTPALSHVSSCSSVDTLETLYDWPQHQDLT